MKAIILAGGQGTRLAPYNTVFPKPLVPLGDRPILDIIIQQLQHYNFNPIYLSLGYLAELIEAYIKYGSPHIEKDKIEFIRETEPLGTVGSLALVPNLKETFLVINGDVLTTLDYKKLVNYHRENGALLTVAMHKRDVKIDLGVLDVNKANEVMKISEKPILHYNVGMGVYVYEPDILKYITPGKYLDFPNLVCKMLDQGDKVVGYPSDDYWLDLGTHTDYSKAQEEFEGLKDKLIHRRKES